MTNLEFHKDEIKEKLKLKGNVYISDCIYQVYVDNHGFHTRNNEQWLLDWLLEEHKEPIKLKKWERDLIRCVNYCSGKMFCSYMELQRMQEKGYFYGVKDTSMTLTKILDNYEIVPDDYKWSD